MGLETDLLGMEPSPGLLCARQVWCPPASCRPRHPHSKAKVLARGMAGGDPMFWQNAVRCPPAAQRPKSCNCLSANYPSGACVLSQTSPPRAPAGGGWGEEPLPTSLHSPSPPSPTLHQGSDGPFLHQPWGLLTSAGPQWLSAFLGWHPSSSARHWSLGSRRSSPPPLQGLGANLRCTLPAFARAVPLSEMPFQVVSTDRPGPPTRPGGPGRGNDTQ